jgi:hypothetical protein
VKLRLRTWLAAALLLTMATFGTPAVRFAIPRVETSIVWVDRSQQAQREIREPRETAISSRSRATLTIPSGDAPAAIRFLDRSLFQRPPPSTFRS